MSTCENSKKKAPPYKHSLIYQDDKAEIEVLGFQELFDDAKFKDVKNSLRKVFYLETNCFYQLDEEINVYFGINNKTCEEL